MIQVWRAVPGIDAAGVIHAVSDEVLSLSGMEPQTGAFPGDSTVPAYMVAKKTFVMMFKEAASLP
ncbi:hypothetical protein MAP00_004297 [Monascus purpureus]|nr:hypothetical protein MAP00_004297 [Monascus purpureus]